MGTLQPLAGVRRHVPRIAAEWDLDAPGRRWQVVDGTMCFADVSGFTALTERLATRGRIGAEELVETLSRVFGSMLDTARDHDGMLLKFGGDALLFLFTGDDHARRACSTALAMQRTLRTAASVPTSVGRLRLSMSVGIRSGDVHAFLVGAPHRELVLIGPAASETALLEHAAQAGEVLVNAATAAALPAASVVLRDGHHQLRARSPIVAPGGPRADRDVDPVVLRSLVAPTLADVLELGPPDAEHRVATIAFIRMSGTDALMASGGPDAVAEALDETLTVIESAFLAEGVTLLAVDVDVDGAKVFAGSGVPHASEDDEGRMLRALRHIVDVGTPLPVQLGVNRGHVFVAEVGTPTRAAYSAMGNTTNTAARIAAKAPPGVLYAHPGVLEHSRTTFASTPAGPFPFKGKAVPVLVYEVGEELGTRHQDDEGVRLVGRTSELEVAFAAVDALSAGRPGVVTVVGPAGSGKTRLLGEARDHGNAIPSVDVRAEPFGVNSAYRVFRDLTRDLLGVTRGDNAAMVRQLRAGIRRVDPDLEPWLPLLGDVAHVVAPSTPEVDALDPRYRPDRTAAVFVRLLERVHPGPLLIVAEDAHWVDDASALLLARLTTSEDRPWLVLLSRRDVDGGFRPDAGVTIALGPLDEDEIRELVLATTEATPLRPHLVDAIVVRSGGNPQFAVELARAVHELGSVDAIPESLQAAVAAQIDALDPTARQVIRCVSVLGRSFRRGVLDEVLRAEGLVLDTATSTAVMAFLEDDGPGRLRFRNGLARDVTYDGLAYRLRARLHRDAGLAVETLSSDVSADADALSTHFWIAGDAERTWRYALAAADRARRAAANADAAVQYERALEASRRLAGVSDDERRQVWVDLGDVRELAGVFDGALDAYRQASRLVADDVVGRARLHLKRARARERAGAFSLALREVSAGRRIVERVHTPTAAEVRARLAAFGAMIRWGQERPGDALRRARAAIDEARAAGAREPLAQALAAAELAAFSVGQPGDGSQLRDAMAIFAELGDLRQETQCVGNLGFLAAYRGEWEEATRLFITCGEDYLRLGDVVGAALAASNVGEILVNQGRYDEADSVLRDAVRVMRVSGYADGASRTELQLVRGLVARDRLDEAEQILDRLVGEFDDLGMATSALEAAVVRADCLVRRADSSTALDQLERAERVAGERAEAVRSKVELARAGALVALGRDDEAADHLARGIDAARRQGLPYEEALLLLARSDLAGGGPADAAEAARILSGLGVEHPAVLSG